MNLETLHAQISTATDAELGDLAHHLGNLIRAVQTEQHKRQARRLDQEWRAAYANLVVRWRQFAGPVVEMDGVLWSPTRLEGILLDPPRRSQVVLVYWTPKRAGDIPPVRIRVHGGRVAHIWTGGAAAACGAVLWRPEATPDLPLCKACERRMA